MTAAIAPLSTTTRVDRRRSEYLPTVEEIADACERIRGEWSERERNRRAGFLDGKPPVWTPPESHVTVPARSDSAFIDL